MKAFRKQAAQGDVLLTVVDSIPEGCERVKPEKGRYIVAHSETGHHHTVNAALSEYWRDPEDPFTCYLRVAGDSVDLEHHRSWHTHETLRLPRGFIKVRRQRQRTPWGDRMVQD